MIAAKGIGRVGELIEKAGSDACFRTSPRRL
jgi:hypothetical protein